MTTKLRANAKRLLPAVLTTILSAVSFAQDVEWDELDEIVVSATRMESSIRDAGRSISLVTKERIQNGSQQLGLDEALSGIPGLYMQNRYNFAQDLRISLRGFGARSSFGIRGVKVIVDGIPETLPDGQAGVDSIDMSSAQSIEVLRGPSSSLYGNASGGVIAISTELDAPPFLEGRVAAGEYGYQQYQFKTGGRIGQANYLFNVSHTEIDGYRENSEARGSLVNSKIALPFGADDKLTFSLNLTDQPEAQDPGGINEAQVAIAPSSARLQNLQFDSGESLEQQRLGIVYERVRSNGTLTLRNHYVWRDFANKLPFTGGGAVNLDRFFYGIGAQYSLGDLLPERFDLLFGIDFDKQDDDRIRFDNNSGVLGNVVFDQNEQVQGTGIYIQGQYEIDDRWTLLGGLRYDELTYDVIDRFVANGNDSGKLDFDQISPSLAINYKTNAGVLFASYSSSFETPTTTELANPDASGGFNPGLDPQLADNIEIGYKVSGDSFFYEIALFSIDLEDELIPFELAAFPGRTFYANAGTSDRAGIEAATKWRLSKNFRIDASFTWSDFRFNSFVDDNGNDFGDNRLPGLPGQYGYFGMTYESDSGFSGTAETIYSGDLYTNNANTVQVSEYFVTNLRFSYQFNRDNWLFRPYLGVNNLFDETYNNNIRINAFGARYFEPAPPLNFYAGIVINYQR